MNKYKDFEELPNDYHEQDLRNLFVKRNYSKRIENPKANDIIIETDDKVSTYVERMALKKKKAVVAFQFPVTTDIESAKFELSFLNPSDIEDYYIRERIKKYLKVCRQIIKEEEKNPKKNDISVIRARAFCIALIQESGKRNFIKGSALMKTEIMDFAKKTWDKPGKTVYDECLNIISKANPINRSYKEDNPKEYELGLKIYKEMFPD